MGLQNNIQMFDQPNTVPTSLWPISSRSTTFFTEKTYHRRYFTCRCRRKQEGPTDETKQARRTPTACFTTSRNS